MIRTMIILAVLLVPSATTNLVAQQTYPTVSAKQAPAVLKLSLHTLNPRIGNKIEIEITMSNPGTKPYVWSAGAPGGSYQEFLYKLISNDGEKVRSTSFHRWMRGEPELGDPVRGLGGSANEFVILPGKSVSFVIDLNKLYELKKVGSYLLTVSRCDTVNRVVFNSAPLTIVITE